MSSKHQSQAQQWKLECYNQIQTRYSKLGKQLASIIELM